MKRHILLTLLATLATLAATADGLHRPRLVVGIVVEGLSTDCLDLLRPQFIDGGFNRLRSSGMAFDDIDYGSDMDATAATALALTGAAPSVNGVGGAHVYDTEKKAAFPTFLDPTKVGNFTTETYSPEALKVSTIADELRVDSRGYGMVESVAAEPDRALLMSGHAGNGAFWISDATGNWASSTYYNDMPLAVSNRNYRQPLKTRLDTAAWRPLFTPALLPGLSEQKRVVQFKHTFQHSDPDRYAAFKASALGNTEVTDLAIDLVNTLHLGTHQATDMINAAYTVAPYNYGLSPDAAVETLDAYIRLDRDIERLLKAAEAQAGAGNVTVFLIGTPAPAHDKRDNEVWKIPFGEFSVKKALSLLNMYLMALHGNGNWVTDYYDRNFYINRQLAKDRQLPLEELRSQSAEFLARMSGVADAYTIDDVIGLQLGDNAAAIKRNTLLSSAGDVIIDVAPGWEIVDDGTKRNPVVQRKARTVTPAFILGPGVSPRTIAETVDARRIAPTVARAIQLRAPNGASLPPVR